jgi:HPt (histidine-containing phosphotransfer) domain-containing protein
MHMATWPDIAGIDRADACARWCGDAALFTTMLARFFDEFLDVSVPAGFNDSESVTPYISRMHTLRGGACMLGAKAVYELAGGVEDACIRGDHDRAAQLSTRLAGEIQRLRENTRQALAGAQITNAVS